MTIDYLSKVLISNINASPLSVTPGDQKPGSIWDATSGRLEGLLSLLASWAMKRLNYPQSLLVPELVFPNIRMLRPQGGKALER